MFDENAAKATARSILNCYVEHIPPDVYERIVSDVGYAMTTVQRETVHETALSVIQALNEQRFGLNIKVEEDQHVNSKGAST